MKVLKDNYTINEVKNKQNYPRKIVCDNCGSELEYEKSDLYMGFLGSMYLDCPLCKRKNMVENNEGAITLTKDNVEFPVHFYHTSKENGAVDCCNNEEIKKYISEAIEFLRKNKEEYSWYCQTGNLYIHVFRYDGDREYYVVVTDSYYDTYIPFEKEDY